MKYTVKRLAGWIKKRLFFIWWRFTVKTGGAMSVVVNLAITADYA
jgi:hypothetical protein